MATKNTIASVKQTRTARHLYRLAKRDADGNVSYVSEWKQYANLVSHAQKPGVSAFAAKTFKHKDAAEEKAAEFNTILRMTAYGKKAKVEFFVEEASLLR